MRHQRRRSLRLLLPAVLLAGGLAAAAPQPALAEDATLADTWAYWEERPYLTIDPRLLVAVGAPADRVRQDSLVATIRSQRDARPPDASLRADEQETLDRMTAEALGIPHERGRAGALPWLAGAGALLASGAGLAWARRRSAARPPATRAPARSARPGSSGDAAAAREDRAAGVTPKRVAVGASVPAPSHGESDAIAAGDLIAALAIPAPSVPTGADVDAHALDLSLAEGTSAPAAGMAGAEPASDLQLDAGFDGELSAPDDTAAPGTAAHGDADGRRSEAPWLLPDETSTRLPPPPPEPMPALAEAPPAPEEDALSLGFEDVAPLLPRFAKLEVKEALLRELRESDLALGFPDGRLAKLALSKIQAIALVEIAQGDARSLLLDLALDWRALCEGGALRVVRLRGPATGAQAEALRLLAEELSSRSGAPLLSPTSDGVLQTFGDADSYAHEVLLVGA